MLGLVCWMTLVGALIGDYVGYIFDSEGNSLVWIFAASGFIATVLDWSNTKRKLDEYNRKLDEK